MQKFSFYHATKESLQKASCLLIEKCYHHRHNSVVLTASEEQQKLFNKMLWTYSRQQFIPHGSRLDPLPEKQPIYITDTLQNPNNATILLVVAPSDVEKILSSQEYIRPFERIIIIYDDLPISLTTLISTINKSVTNVAIDCYQQNPNGSWKQNTLCTGWG